MGNIRLSGRRSLCACCDDGPDCFSGVNPCTRSKKICTGARVVKVAAAVEAAYDGAWMGDTTEPHGPGAFTDPWGFSIKPSFTVAEPASIPSALTGFTYNFPGNLFTSVGRYEYYEYRTSGGGAQTYEWDALSANGIDITFAERNPQPANINTGGAGTATYADSIIIKRRITKFSQHWFRTEAHHDTVPDHFWNASIAVDQTERQHYIFDDPLVPLPNYYPDRGGGTWFLGISGGQSGTPPTTPVPCNGGTYVGNPYVIQNTENDAVLSASAGGFSLSYDDPVTVTTVAAVDAPPKIRLTGHVWCYVNPYTGRPVSPTYYASEHPDVPPEDVEADAIDPLYVGQATLDAVLYQHSIGPGTEVPGWGICDLPWLLYKGTGYLSRNGGAPYEVTVYFYRVGPKLWYFAVGDVAYTETSQGAIGVKMGDGGNPLTISEVQQFPAPITYHSSPSSDPHYTADDGTNFFTSFTLSASKLDCIDADPDYYCDTSTVCQGCPPCLDDADTTKNITWYQSGTPTPGTGLDYTATRTSRYPCAYDDGGDSPIQFEPASTGFGVHPDRWIIPIVDEATETLYHYVKNCDGSSGIDGTYTPIDGGPGIIIVGDA